MTERRAIDLAAVRRARANLRRIAVAHPELVGPPSRENRAGWEKTLEGWMGDDDKHERNDKQFAMRLPQAILDRVDAFAMKHRKETGENMSRADAMRVLVVSALDAAGVRKPSAVKGKAKR